MDRFEQLRQADLMLSMRLLNIPYIWAGQSWDGCDCSGSRILVYRTLKIIRPTDDYTAHGLYQVFGDQGLILKPVPGSFTIYGESFSRITHIAFNLTEELSIDAPGGNSKIKEPDPDIVFGIHSIHRRSDVLAYVDPYLHLKKQGATP